MKLLRYLVLNGLFAVGLWIAIVGGNIGVERIVSFWAWALGILGTAVLVSTEVRKTVVRDIKEKGGPTVPQLADTIYDLAVTCAMLYAGWWFTAAIYFLHMLGLAAAREEYKKRKEVCDD